MGQAKKRGALHDRMVLANAVQAAEAAIASVQQIISRRYNLAASYDSNAALNMAFQAHFSALSRTKFP